MFIFFLSKDQLERKRIAESKKMDSCALKLMGVVSQMMEGANVQREHDRLRRKIEKCMVRISKIDERMARLSGITEGRPTC